jgi:hypothetical protein
VLMVMYFHGNFVELLRAWILSGQCGH